MLPSWQSFSLQRIHEGPDSTAIPFVLPLTSGLLDWWFTLNILYVGVQILLSLEIEKSQPPAHMLASESFIAQTHLSRPKHKNETHKSQNELCTPNIPNQSIVSKERESYIFSVWIYPLGCHDC